MPIGVATIFGGEGVLRTQVLHSHGNVQEDSTAPKERIQLPVAHGGSPLTFTTCYEVKSRLPASFSPRLAPHAGFSEVLQNDYRNAGKRAGNKTG